MRRWTVATFFPSRSIAIVLRTWSLGSWIFATSFPSASSRTNVSRMRIALPFTLKTLLPPSSSIQESSPIEASFSRI